MSKTKNGYKRRSKCKFLLYAHVILVVKYRKPLLIKYGSHIKQKVIDISGVKWRVESLEVDRDHMHLLLEYDPQVSISSIVRSIKSQTTHDLWVHYGFELSSQFWKKHTFWSPSFFACSIGNASKETIDRYIQNQG